MAGPQVDNNIPDRSAKQWLRDSDYVDCSDDVSVTILQRHLWNSRQETLFY